MEPTYKEWDNDLRLEYKQLLVLEKNLVDKIDLPDPNDASQNFLARVAIKKIQALKLPLKFNYLSLHFLVDMTKNTSRIVVALIDLLNMFNLTQDSQPHKIMLKDIDNLYHGRNYSDKYFEFLVDQIKSDFNEISWSWVY